MMEPILLIEDNEQNRYLVRFLLEQIIAVTSHAMPGDRASAIAAGCTGYIEKPIDPATFLDQIESIVSAGQDQ